ncbi:MAG TPA: alpha/beta fold hydrolase, partial [Myxococcota bacterium]|nr:alpha/beta fold hydrolase [Myxococcota bacterium]
MEHLVRVGADVTLHVLTNASRPASTRAEPARAALFLPGTLVTGALCELPLEDATAAGDAFDVAAEHGFLLFAVTYEGYGKSSKPPDGKLVTPPRLLPELQTLMGWIRREFNVGRVDLIGTSVGASLAMALSAQSDTETPVGRLVLASVTYKTLAPAMRAQVLSPALRQALLAAPDGYLRTEAAHYGPLLAGASTVVAAWAAQRLPGVYAVGPTLAGFELPIFPASRARGEALTFWGERDILTPREDHLTLQQEFGGSMRSAVLAEAGHAPHLEPVRAQVWRQTFEFLAQSA